MTRDDPAGADPAVHAAAPESTPRPGTGLSAAQIEVARRVGERLQSEFRSVIRAFPIEARTIAQMSDWLGVTRPVCQRLLRGVRHRGDAITALSFFPGVKGLRQVIEAARRRRCDEPLLAVAGAAVDRYAALIDEHGGSQTRLLAALEAVNPAPTGGQRTGTFASDVLQARQGAFENLRLVTGREFQTHLAAFIYRPCPDDPTRMDCVTAMGMIGIHRREGSLPICPTHTFSYGSQEQLDEANIHLATFDDEPAATGAPVAVLEEFCTRPLPVVVARQINGVLPVLIDPDRASEDPIDVVLGTRFAGVTHPAHDEPRIQNCSLVSDGPARNLLMSVHLHRSLAQASIPSLASYFLGSRGPISTPDAGKHGDPPANFATHRWFDRLPDRPRLEHLGFGLEQSGSSAYPRMSELVDHLLRSQGWAPDEFVGYRCQVPYPIWGAQYLITFDFGEGPADPD
ncbi:MAG: hypothetical protein ACYTGG_10655 [Planctomycetota bacterium]